MYRGCSVTKTCESNEERCILLSTRTCSVESAPSAAAQSVPLPQRTAVLVKARARAAQLLLLCDLPHRLALSFPLPSRPFKRRKGWPVQRGVGCRRHKRMKQDLGGRWPVRRRRLVSLWLDSRRVEPRQEKKENISANKAHRPEGSTESSRLKRSIAAGERLAAQDGKRSAYLPFASSRAFAVALVEVVGRRDEE